MYVRFLCILVLSTFFVACGKKTEFVVPEDKTPASEKVGDYFLPIQNTKDTAYIAIKRTSFKKEFLLATQLIQQPVLPQFQGSKTRVVLFYLGTNEVHMYESPVGATVNTEIDAKFLLASFPIVRSDKNYVVFNFEDGMDKIYVAEDWRASDYDDATKQRTKNTATYRVQSSHIEKTYISSSKRQLVIQKNAKLDTGSLIIPGRTTLEADNNLDVKVQFYISPYRPNADFEPTLSKGFNRMGFFEVSPVFENGNLKTLATKFGPGPITFAISANTPEAYREAVREGILYWNKAFGEERINVVIAPEGVSAPHPDYNVVQWVNWDTAGMAYADAQMDPRTGEILHAQVFQTSVFAIANKNRARAYLRSIKDNHAHEDDANHESAHSFCNRNTRHSAKMLAQKIIALDADEETALRMSQDAVREVVAHEIGHTLGLRHNFAGNLGASFEATQLDEYFQLYLAKAGNMNRNHIPTSSVMDYFRMESAMIGGELIKTSNRAFFYDRMAIKHLYKGENVREMLPLYCTDSHRGKLIGCDVWDNGNSVVANLKRKQQVALAGLPHKLIERYILAITNPNMAARRNPDEIEINPSVDYASTLSYRTNLFKLFNDDIRSLLALRSFKRVDETTIKRVKDFQRDELQVEVEANGGVQALLPRPSESTLAELRADTMNLLESPQYQTGIGYDGQPYNLSSKQTKEIKSVLNEYFDHLDKVMATVDLANLNSRLIKLNESHISDELAQVYYERALRYVLTETSERIEADVRFGDEKAIRVSLPVFKYDIKVRKEAIKLLKSQKSLSPYWGKEEKKDLKDVFKNAIKSILNDKDINKVDLKALEDGSELKKWFKDNRSLLADTKNL